MIIDWKASWENESINRKSVNPKSICTFGIKPLDDALIGFLPDDLVVIAADSGTGKTEIGQNVALHNAINGRSVALYSIEGSDESAISRMKWKTMKDLYYKANRKDIHWDFRKWRMNLETNPEVAKLEKEAMEFLDKQIGNRLHLYHVNESFTIKDFKNSLAWFKSKESVLDQYLKHGTQLEHKLDIDLLIIDHLQYFTFDNPMNEMSDTTEILKELKNIAEYHKIPVLLISHLRKKEKNRGLPNQEDLFGTSNIAKICSQLIVIAPAHAGIDYTQDIYPTFFRYCKSRTGLKSNFAILCDFHARTSKYAEEYKLFYLHENQIKDEIKPHQLPSWAYRPNYLTATSSVKPVAVAQATVNADDIQWEDS